MMTRAPVTFDSSAHLEAISAGAIGKSVQALIQIVASSHAASRSRSNRQVETTGM